MSVDQTRQAKNWWGTQVNDRPVWRTDDLPERDFKEILVSLKLAYEVRRDTLVLGKPDTELPVLIRSFFWEIVSCVLQPYSPYALSGTTAIELHLGKESIPKEVHVLTRKSSTRIDLHGISSLILEKNLDRQTRTLRTAKGYPLTVETPENLLLRLKPRELRDFPQVISSFLKAVDFDRDALRALLEQESRPIVYSRLAALFEQVGKLEEATLIKTMVKITTDYASPGKSQIIKNPLPRAVASPKRISDPAYVTRFRDQLRFYRDQASEALNQVTLPHWKLEKLLAYAEQTKKYDAYHSSTIEGYRVTQEEIQSLIDGRPVVSNGASREEIERKMALKGYLAAHRFVLETVSEHFKNGNPVTVTELIVREIYAHLFSPSVEAGLISKDQLTRYRNIPVYIRNSRHIPPGHEKMDDLMRCLVEEVNSTENKAACALLAHYGFVTVHPYPDGNGRVSRLLMNSILSLGGIPWITIRVEDRDKYFHALEAAQCDEDIDPFIQFLKGYFEESLGFAIH